MAHYIQLFVGKKEDLSKFSVYDSDLKIYTLNDAELMVLPLTENLYDSMHKQFKEKGINNGDGFLYYTSTLDEVASKFSTNSSIAYIETEYHGGTGGQGACVWRHGDLVYGPKWISTDEKNDLINLPINNALRLMGLSINKKASLLDKLCSFFKKSNYTDEFTAFGLGMIRYNEQLETIDKDIPS